MNRTMTYYLLNYDRIQNTRTYEALAEGALA